MAMLVHIGMLAEMADHAEREDKHYIHWDREWEKHRLPVFAQHSWGSLSLTWILGFSLARLLRGVEF